MYRRKKSRRKDLPLRKAPATDTTTTCLSLTWSCMRMSSSAASSSSNEWSSLARTTWMALPPPLLLTATSSSIFPADKSTHNQHAELRHHRQTTLSDWLSQQLIPSHSDCEMWESKKRYRIRWLSAGWRHFQGAILNYGSIVLVWFIWWSHTRASCANDGCSG